MCKEHDLAASNIKTGHLPLR